MLQVAGPIKLLKRLSEVLNGNASAHKLIECYTAVASL
jgi:hypothetical protein